MFLPWIRTASEQSSRRLTGTVTRRRSGVIDIGGKISFLDDGPGANDDSDTVDNNTDTAVGNVITGSGTTEGTGNADNAGADGFGSITGVVSDANDNSDTNPAGGFTVVGAYGTLQMDADGNYTYTRDPASPGAVNESFTYTYVDGDGDPVSAVLTITIDDSVPSLPDPDVAHLDDDVVPGLNGNVPDGPGDDDPDVVGQNSVDGTLVGSGGDGDLDYYFSASQTGLPTGFTIDPASTATHMIILQGGNPVLTIDLNNETGDYTVTQVAAITHPSLDNVAGDNTENNIPNINIDFYAQDVDGSQSPPATLTIDVDDDTPTIDVTKGSDSAVNLTTDDAQTIGVNSDTAQSAANFSGVFGLTQSAGADGTNAAATLLYALDVTGYAGGPGGVNSGLESHDADIFLYEIGGKVVGSTSATLAGVTVGNTVFDVGVNGSGVVTLTQYQQIDHDTVDPTPTGGPPFADHIVSLTDSLITLTASASLTDKDGDTVTDSEVVNIGANLHFTDDGPTADVSGTGVGTVKLDETRAEGTDTVGGTAPTGDQSATIDFSVNFVTGGSVNYGADGPGSPTYALQLTGSNVNSGLYALDNTDLVAGGDGDGYGQGGQIVLNQVGNTITGSYNGTNYFTITIDPATGIVTFTELNNIWHPIAGSSAAALDDTATLNTLAANLIQVVQTVTDFDGDTDTASIDIGQGVFQIQDDGPRFGPDIDATLSILNDATPTNTGDLDIVIGTDSPNGGTGNNRPGRYQRLQLRRSRLTVSTVTTVT